MCGGGRAAGGPGWREAERGYFWLRGSAARGRVAAREGVGVTYEVSASRTPHGTGSRNGTVAFSTAPDPVPLRTR
jgi:hypothetical protein